MASLAPVAQWIEYLTSNQSVACSNHAGGIFYLMTSNPQERGQVSVGCVFAPVGYRRITPGTLCITTRTSRGHSQNRRARYHKRIRHCEPLIATKGRGSLSYFCQTPTTLIHLVGAKHPF